MAGAQGGESGQTTVEWVALVTLVALVVGAVLLLVPAVDGRTFGGLIAHRIACAVRSGCADGQLALAAAYGAGGAALVRNHAPGLVYEPGERQLPVDWRRCRRRACAEGPGDRDLDLHRSEAGERTTVFTRMLRRGGRTYVQYWLYYPDSNTTWAGSDKVWDAFWFVQELRGAVRDAPPYPGFHRDDWESYQVRLDADGSVWARASSHGHFQGCKQRRCAGQWTRGTGWTRVSRGSHAGHIPLRDGDLPAYPGPDLRERTSTPDGLRLVPIETLERGDYRRLDPGIAPPWEKESYRHPEANGS